MKFKMWLENEMDGTSDGFAPASAEVQRTGLQPQVDSQEIQTKEKEHHDKLMGLDSQMQRIRTIIDQMDIAGSKKLKRARDFCREMVDQWDKLKTEDDSKGMGDMGLGAFNPNQKQVQWMQDNQPLPEDPLYAAGMGIGGSF